MTSIAPFPPLLLDDAPNCQSERQNVPCGHEFAGRIWNVFDQADLEVIVIHPDERNPILRIYDFSLISLLSEKKLDHLPIILSHLIDLPDAPLPGHKAGIAIEVANRADLERANSLSCSLIIGRSFESPGPSKESSAFIIYQLLKAESRHPFYIHGATGYALFQAYLALGVTGIVLSPDQFDFETRDKTVRFSLSGNNILRLAFAGGTPEAIAYRKVQEENPDTFLKSSFVEAYWSSGKGDLWGGELREKTLEYLKLHRLSPRKIVAPPCFAEGSPAAFKTKCKYPFFQGAMANITQCPDFAEAVAKGGAFPCLALAGLSVQRSSEIVRETAQRGFSFAANFVALSLSSEDLEELIVLFEETRPTYVVISAPQLDHVNRLLKTDLDIMVHAPNRAMFKVLYDMGCRNFIIEGEEAGGHTSNIGGLSAWQGILEEIRDGSLQDKVHLVFAGGIHDRMAADMLSSLLFFYGLDRDLMVSLQMGTAYLSTAEAIEFTELPDVYRQTIIEGDDTMITGESVHRNVRQMVTSHSADLLEKEWSIFSSDIELQEKKKAYEKLYQGGLKLAVRSEKFEEDGSYMAGAVSALLQAETDIQALHQGLLQENSKRHRESPEPIAIVGIGSILPGSKNVNEHFSNLLFKRCFIRDTPDSIWERQVYLDPDGEEGDTSSSGIVAMHEEVDSDLKDLRIPPSVSDEMTQLQIVTLRCAQQALEDAGYFERPFPKKRVAVIVGAAKDEVIKIGEKLSWKKERVRLEELIKSQAYDSKLTEEWLRECDERYDQIELTADSFMAMQSNLTASRVASVFDFQGLAHCVDAACSSALAAMAQAVTLLQDRQCDVVISGGVDTSVNMSSFAKFSSLQALSNKGSFPFDQRADGFVIGAGGALFVLKRYEDAVRNGDEIYALIRGWGAASDGAGKGITAPDCEGQTRCLQNSYYNAEIDPDDLDFLECHATGTPVGDAEERKTVAEFFGKNRIRKNKKNLPIGGSKAITGHVRNGAGAVGMLSGIFAVNHRCVPPQVNFENAPEGVSFETLGLHVPKRPEVIESEEVVAGVSSFGFGGINYHMLLSSSPENQRAPILDVTNADFPVFDDLMSDVAFVFPGQGSQYPGMLHDLKDHPEVAHLLKQADEIYARYSGSPLTPLLLNLPSGDPEILEDEEQALRATEVSQPAIVLVAAVMLELMKVHKAIKPALVLGHSLGEYSALYAAGILSFEDVFTLACLRGQLMGVSRAGEAGAMLVIGGRRELAQGLIEQVEGYAVCANLNSCQQTVISGEVKAIEQIVKLADRDGIRFFPLNVARAFHSKLVADCIEPMREHLKGITFYRSEIPVLACVSREVFPVMVGGGAEGEMNEEEMRASIELLSRQVDHPVDFISQINAAYESGIRRFVEVGPKGVLTHLIEQILENRPLQTERLDQEGLDTPTRIQALEETLRQELQIKRQAPPERIKRRKKEQVEFAAAAQPMSVFDQIVETVASISGYEPSSIDKNAEFERDLGIDTLKIFEILSRLRGDILPQEIEKFRELTSVGKIQALAEKHVSEGLLEEKSNGSVKIEYYKHKMVPTANLCEGGAAVSLKDYGVDRIGDPYRGDKRQIVWIRPLPTALNSLVDELLPELHRQVIDWAGGSEKGRPAHVHIMTYCEEAQFYDGAFFAIEAMLKVVNLDVPEIQFSYAHFDGDLISEAQTAKVLALSERLPDTGKHVQRDGSLSQGSLFPLVGLFGSEDSLSSLLSEEDVVLITGGARGIASHIAKHLIRMTDARFILIGRKRETEGWIQQVPDERVIYLAADLTNPEEIVSLGLGRRGITLILHAAGIEVARNILNKSSQEFYRTIATKATSLEQILSSIDVGILRGVVQFSSVAAYRGVNGQSDYAAANALLNGCLEGDVPALSIAWPAWSEIGMASRGVIKEILETKGAAFISPQEAWQVFAKLLSGFLQFPPSGVTRFVAMGDLPGPYLAPFDGEIPIEEGNAMEHYLLSDPDQKIQVTLDVDLEQTPGLCDHVFGRQIYLPGAVILRAILRQILKERAEVIGSIGISDIEFLSPMVVEQGACHQIHCSRKDDFFLAEIEAGDVLRPLVSLKLDPSVWSDQQIDEDVRMLDEMQVLAARRLTPFDIHRVDLSNSEESRFEGAFAVLSALQYNGPILTAQADMKRVNAGKSILGDTGRVPFFLESAFQTGGQWRQFRMGSHHRFMPKHADHCRIYFHRCQGAKEAKVFSRLIKSDESSKELHLDIAVVNEKGELLIVLRNFILSAINVPELLPVYSLPLGAPFRLSQSELLILPIGETYRYAHSREQEIITKSEEAEIQALSSKKRRQEKIAGKLVSKFLVRHLLEAEGVDQKILLSDIEVHSDESPVSIKTHSYQFRDQFYFSISHSDDLVCSVGSENPVGVDLEKIRPLAEKVVSDFCGERLEQEIRNYIAGGGFSIEDRAFLEQALPILIFTQKEAVLKAAGIGIGEGLSEVRIDGIHIQSPTIATYRDCQYEVTSRFDRNQVLSVASLLREDRPVSTYEELKEVPISFLQRSILRRRGRASSGGSKNYTLALRMQMEGRIDQEVLQMAVNCLVHKHEILRTVFKRAGDAFVGSVLDLREVEIAQISAEQSGDGDHTKSLSLTMDERSCVHFDLGKGPLFLVQLFRLNDEEHTLQLVFDHSIMDCFSALILAQELVEIYRQIDLGNEPLASASQNYADFVCRESKSVNSKRLVFLQDYWSRRLNGVQAYQLPLPEKSSIERGASGQYDHSIEYEMDSDQLRRMDQSCRKIGTTLFAGLLSVFQITLAKFCKQSQGLLYVPFSLRDRILDAGATGPFIRLLPVRADFIKGESYADFVIAQRSALFDAIEHSAIPSADLDGIIREQSSEVDVPMIICQLIEEPDAEGKDLPLAIKSTVHDGVNPRASMTLTFFYSAGRMRCVTTFNQGLIDRRTVEEVLGLYLAELKLMSADPSQVIDGARKRGGELDLVERLGVAATPAPVERKESRKQSGELNREQVIDHVVVIWQYALQDDYLLKKDANFFEMGGSSLQAVEIVSGIKSSFGLELPLSSFVDAPTPALQAELILSRNWEGNWEPLVALKAEGSKSPFFCVHPSDGNVLCYSHLAAAMGEEYPFYGLQAKGLNGKDEPLRDVVEMARHYLDAIREVCPGGPYHLGGWSAGGVIAFEMAQQLMATGEQVQLLLIDTIFPQGQKKSALESASQATTGGGKKTTVDEKNRTLLFGEESSPAPETYQQAHTLRDIWAEASDDYEAQAYPGKITLFLSDSYNQRKQFFISRLKFQIGSRNMGRSAMLIRMLEDLELMAPVNWQKLADKGFETISTPGDHHSLLYKENCGDLAQNIMRSIDSFEAE